jgi:hypothetical protein
MQLRLKIGIPAITIQLAILSIENVIIASLANLIVVLRIFTIANLKYIICYCVYNVKSSKRKSELIAI